MEFIWILELGFWNLSCCVCFKSTIITPGENMLCRVHYCCPHRRCAACRLPDIAEFNRASLGGDQEEGLKQVEKGK